MNLREETERQFALLAASTLGDRIERVVRDVTSPFANMIARSQAEYVAAILSLVDADLHTPDGITKAISLQAQARRYIDLCSWVNDALEAAEIADEELATEDEDDGEALNILKEQMNGKRSKPAPDA